MKKPLIRTKLIAGLLLCSLLAACGQKGPLFLPAPPPQKPAQSN